MKVNVFMELSLPAPESGSSAGHVHLPHARATPKARRPYRIRVYSPESGRVHSRLVTSGKRWDQIGLEMGCIQDMHTFSEDMHLDPAPASHQNIYTDPAPASHENMHIDPAPVPSKARGKGHVRANRDSAPAHDPYSSMAGGSATPTVSQPPQPVRHTGKGKKQPSCRSIPVAASDQPDSFESPGGDLRDLLNKKRSASQVTPHCRCERIIASVLADCNCSSPAQTKSVFDRLSGTRSSKLAKRLRFNNEDIPSDDEYPEVSVNMAGRDTGKQPVSEPEGSTTPGVYQGTRSRSGALRPVNYRALAQAQEQPKDHSAIAESQSSSSSGERAVYSFAANTPEEVARLLAQQAQAQQAQQEQIRAQAQSIDALKEMVQQLLERADKKPSKHGGSTSRSKEQGHESSDSDSSIRFHSPHGQDETTDPRSKTDNQDKPEPDPKAVGDNAVQRMKRLEEQVAALKTTHVRQEAGATRPYPVEWDAVKYPSKFKVPKLNPFYGKGSAQQHIYYFQSQTGNLVGNDPVRTRLFVSTLKGPAFEWFRKLAKGSITCWDDLEALFLSRFFEEEVDVNMHTLLLTKQKEGESIKEYIERFRDLAMRSRSGMTPEVLVETCRHNFLTPILVQMGVVECKTWKQLQEHGQTAEELVALVKTEEKHKTHRSNKPPPRRNTESSAKKETLAADAQQPSSPLLQG